MFSEKNYKKQKKDFLFCHSLALDRGLEKTRSTLRDSVWFVDILDLDFKSPRTIFTGVGLILWYSGLGLKKHLNNSTWLGLILLYIELGFWIDWMNWLSRDAIRKVEDVLELSVKQFVIQSSPTSVGQIMYGVCKTKC